MTIAWRGSVLLAASLGLLATSGCMADDPFDFGGPRSCEVLDQNVWVQDLMQEAYLWSDEMTVVDPAAYDHPAQMVAELRAGPDRWSRVSDKARTDALFEEGKVITLGFRTRRDPYEHVRIAEVYADSPAEAAGLRRGDRLVAVAGLSVDEIDEEGRWSEVYGPTEPGVTVALDVIDPGGDARSLSVTKDWVAIDPVPVDGLHQVDGRPVGYLQFATFVDTSVAALNEVFAGWAREGVREVVIDLRYNGGGLVSVARHFMHLLAGAQAEGRTAYRVRYNANFAGEDMDRALMRLDQSLPGLDHVVFITTGSSLSASELVINAVAAHARVSIVGSTTGGKPVGSKHFDFCDRVAAPITFHLVNADDEGDYFDGMVPDCPAPDDLDHALGSPEEAAMAAALHRLATGECLPPPELPPVELSGPRRPSARAEPDPWPVLAELR